MVMLFTVTADSSGFEQHRYAPPPDAVEVVLVRHGASEAALPGQSFSLVDGQGDPALSEVGRAQARSVATALSAEPFAAMFASNLRRTQETARPLAEENGLDVKVLADLREVFLGELEGGGYRIKLAEGHPLVAEAARQERWDVIPGAESPEAFSGRLRSAIEEIVASVPAGTSAVAFAHGAVIGQLCAMAAASRPFAFLHADNGSITRLIVHGDGRWLLRSFNETQHLDPPAGPVG
jgi:probable phosphoglycerate mutase